MTTPIIIGRRHNNTLHFQSPTIISDFYPTYNLNSDGFYEIDQQHSPWSIETLLDAIAIDWDNMTNAEWNTLLLDLCDHCTPLDDTGKKSTITNNNGKPLITRIP